MNFQQLSEYRALINTIIIDTSCTRHDIYLLHDVSSWKSFNAFFSVITVEVDSFVMLVIRILWISVIPCFIALKTVNCLLCRHILLFIHMLRSFIVIATSFYLTGRWAHSMWNLHCFVTSWTQLSDRGQYASRNARIRNTWHCDAL